MNNNPFKKLRHTFQNYQHQHNQNGHAPHGLRPDKKPDLKKIALWILLGFVGLIGTGIIAFGAAIALLSINLPDVRDLDKLSIAQSTTIYDREGNVLYVKFGAENREYKKLSQISPNIINATLAIEDKQFYTHPGFNIIGLARAVLNNLTGGSQQGGSTITQQYIKLAFLSSEKSYIRKIKELILAVRMEEAFDKDTILEKYLNKIPYGNNAFGVEKAAQTYFNKSASELSIAESAILAAIPQAPGYYNPYGAHKYTVLASGTDSEKLASRNIDSESNLLASEIQRGLIGQYVRIGDNEVYLQGRADLVLKNLEEIEYINHSQLLQAREEMMKIQFLKYRQSIKAPHFVFHVLNQLEEQYGKEIVEQGGLKVYTTIDPKMQEAAEKIISEKAESNQEKYNVKNSALVALNPQNGQILAMVGSRNYFDEEIDGQTNIVTSFRQPGSTFKPFVYAQAFIKRFAPATVIFDVPTPIGGDSPKNFDGKFLGPLTIREALAKSRNIPAIKAYFVAGEQKEIMPLAKSMGVIFQNEETEHGYPFSIGAAETTLLGMTNGYGTFANGGLHYEPISILRVENASGEILEEFVEKPGDDVLDPQIAFLINSILSDTTYRIGPNITLNGRPNAAKTGTSNRKINGKYYPHDLLTIGYTPTLVTGVWSGNNDSRKDGELNFNADGYNVSGPIFKAFMDEVLKDTPAEDFSIPEGIKQETVTKYNGKLAGPGTPLDQQVTDFFASFSVPTEIDDSSGQIPDFSASENLSTAYCPAQNAQVRTVLEYHDIDPTRESWETAAQTWLSENLTDFNQGSIICKPSIDLINVTFTTPENNSAIPSTSAIDVAIKSSSSLKEVHYYLDDKLVQKITDTPFNGRIRLPRGGTQTVFKITARAYDHQGNIGEQQITINLTP